MSGSKRITLAEILEEARAVERLASALVERLEERTRCKEPLCSRSARHPGEHAQWQGYRYVYWKTGRRWRATE